jgi:hypothetical protein
MALKVRDRVWITDSIGMKTTKGEIVNINNFREPEMKYAVSADGHSEDLLFFGEDRLIKQEEK